jgi:hypothetical protein
MIHPGRRLLIHGLDERFGDVTAYPRAAEHLNRLCAAQQCRAERDARTRILAGAQR